MGLFDKTDLAVQVGILTEKLRTVEERCTKLEQRKTHEPETFVPLHLAPHAIPSKITATIRVLAGADAALVRHLEEEARTLLAYEMAEGDVIQALARGSQRPVRA